MPKKVVYFVRHGLSIGNAEGVVSGSEYDCDLTEEGRQQARMAGQSLSDIKVDLIVSSSMRRTRETAQLIADQLDYDPQKIVIKDEFIERSMGYYSQRPVGEYRADVEADSLHDSLESSQAMSERVARGLDWIAEQKAQQIVIVSHAETSRMVKIINQDLHHGDIHKVVGLKNSEVYEFTL